MMPELTIGLIVKNGAPTIGRAIESLLAQSFTDFHLYIFDNASTDSTGEICRALMIRDSRILYTRHESDIGAAKNLHFALQFAQSEFFMWATADDYWAPDHVMRNIGILRQNATVLASQSRVLFTQNGIPSRMSEGTYSLSTGRTARLIRFLLKPADNSRFYGVHRTAALKAAFPEEFHFAYDWAVSARVLGAGRYHEVQDVLMMRDETAAGNYARAAASFATGAIDRVFPLSKLTKSVLMSLKFAEKLALIPVLALLNVRIALRFMTLRRLPSGTVSPDKNALSGLFSKLLSPGIRENLSHVIGKPPTGRFELGSQATANLAPALSIICLSLNGIEPLLQIGTVIKRSGRRDVQWIIVDFGSSDVTRHCLSALAGQDIVFADPTASVQQGLAQAAKYASASQSMCLFVDDNAPNAVGSELEQTGGTEKVSKRADNGATFIRVQTDLLKALTEEAGNGLFEALAVKLQERAARLSPKSQATAPSSRAT